MGRHDRLRLSPEADLFVSDCSGEGGVQQAREFRVRPTLVSRALILGAIEMDIFDICFPQPTQSDMMRERPLVAYGRAAGI